MMHVGFRYFRCSYLHVCLVHVTMDIEYFFSEHFIVMVKIKVEL